MNTRLPEHTNKNVARTPKDSKIPIFARAPYNFVPLPQQIVKSSEPPDHDHYEGNSGWIDCELETLTPLYIRGLLTNHDFSEFGDKTFYDDSITKEQRNRRANFFSVGNDIRIPGSSLRGMIRALVEIAGFGKTNFVSDEQRFFYRAVAASKDDPLGKLYKQQMGAVKAGFVEKTIKEGKEFFYIRPAKLIGSKESFIKAREIEGNRKPSQVIDSSVPYLRMDQPGYHPGCVEISFDYRKTPNGRFIASQVDIPSKLAEKGWLVYSGNMSENSKEKFKSQRKNHCVVSQPDTRKPSIPINPLVVEDYRNSLTDFQKESPFDNKYGCLIEGRPIFYFDDGVEVLAFGHSPNFRIPFLRNSEMQASRSTDYLPSNLREETDIDLAEAIFGYVKSSKQPYGKKRAYAGRVFFEDATALEGQKNLMAEQMITPAILSSPKPSTFQHYLVQTDDAAHHKLQLKHYASDTPNETVLRGSKFYWHRKINNVSDVKWKPSDGKKKTKEQQFEDAKKQLTGIKPVRANAWFKFKIRFENLSDAELGALLWSLDLPAGYAHKLGMGKPLGLGSIRITVKSVNKIDRPLRYQSLFNGNKWATCDISTNNFKLYKDAFETFVLKQMDGRERGHATEITNTPRIRELLCMLAYDKAPSVSETRYMEIEHAENDNEYRERPVLPLPSVFFGGKPLKTNVSQSLSPISQSEPPRPAQLLGGAGKLERRPSREGEKIHIKDGDLKLEVLRSRLKEKFNSLPKNGDDVTYQYDEVNGERRIWDIFKKKTFKGL